MEWLKIPVQFDYDEPEPAVFDNDMIRFNGVEDNGHETFMVSQVHRPSYRQEEKGKLFQFCKTARKPYDTAVTACLIILKHYFQNDIIVRSDGTEKEWQNGVNAVQECLNYGEFPCERKNYDD